MFLTAPPSGGDVPWGPEARSQGPSMSPGPTWLPKSTSGDWDGAGTHLLQVQFPLQVQLHAQKRSL